MNNVELPSQFTTPKEKVNVLISGRDMKDTNIKHCIEFVKSKFGRYFFEIIWINDGSNLVNTKILKELLNEFENNTRFLKIIYIRKMKLVKD